jgi:hypothetical protein
MLMKRSGPDLVSFETFPEPFLKTYESKLICFKITGIWIRNTGFLMRSIERFHEGFTHR